MREVGKQPGKGIGGRKVVGWGDKCHARGSCSGKGRKATLVGESSSPGEGEGGW